MNASGPYALFKTDPELETKGVKLDYGDFWIQVARAGGANDAYARELEKRLRPHRRAIQTETLSNELAQRLLVEAFSASVVLGWGSAKHGEGRIPARDGSPLDFSFDAAVTLFTDLPELFADVRDQSSKLALFRAEEQQADAGN